MLGSIYLNNKIIYSSMRSILVFLFISFSTVLSAQHLPDKLTSSATFKVLTCNAGDELYSAFGHTALLVTDDSLGLNLVFNWGTFDFSDPNFYSKFTQGKLEYFLSIESFDYFVRTYTYLNRGVKSQTLGLTPAQQEKFWSLLKENYKPANRTYLYDFFYDNCTTRLLDMILEVTNNTVLLPEFNKEHYTFRDYINIDLDKHPWAKFGIAICLGTPTDKIPNKKESLFLPENLYQSLEETTINGRSIVTEHEQFVEGVSLVKEENNWTSPTEVFIVLLLLGVMFYIFKNIQLIIRINNIVRIIIYTAFSLLGCLILFLWFGTDHVATLPNYNILWLHPLWFVLLFKPDSKWLKLAIGIGVFAYVILLLLNTQAGILAFVPFGLLPFLSMSIRYKNKAKA